MKNKKLISMLLGCAICGCSVTGIAVMANADGEAAPETAKLTIGLNGGFRTAFDKNDANAAVTYSEADVEYTAEKGGLVLTHEKVREIFDNQPAFQKAVGGIDYSKVANPNNNWSNLLNYNGEGENRKEFCTVDENGYYNFWKDHANSGGGAAYSAVLFGLFEDKDGDGRLDDGEPLYQSGDTINITADMNLKCWYNESLIYGSLNSSWAFNVENTLSLRKAWTAEGSDKEGIKYNAATQQNGWRTEYTARDLQPLYFELGEIGGQAFSIDGGWGTIGVEKVELPDTVKILSSYSMQKLGALKEINLDKVQYIYDEGFRSPSQDVMGEKRYVFENIRGISKNNFGCEVKGGSSYRFIFADTGMNDEEVHKLLSYHNASGNESDLAAIFGDFGIAYAADKAGDMATPTTYVYVPYGKTELFYANEAAYASGKTSFSVFKEGETIKRTNIPMREMYPVSFNLNGGSMEEGVEAPGVTYMDARAVSVTRGEKEANIGDGTTLANNPAAQTLGLLKAEKPADPVKEGYAFKGWMDQKGYMWTAADWENGGKAGVDYGSEGVILTAQWGQKVSLTWVYNNGQPDSAPEIVAEGSLLKAPENNPTPKQYYTFTGWYKDEACTQAWDFETELVPNTDFSIYAGYEAQTMSITLNADGGTLQTSDTVTADGANYKLAYKYDIGAASLPVPVKEGYTFEGWYNGNDKVTAIAANSVVSVLTARYTKDIVTSTITYSLDGGTLEGGKTRDEYTEGESFTLPVPEKEGYTFGGWYRLANLSGSAVTEIDASETGDITVYAKWTKDSPIKPPDSGSDSGSNSGSGSSSDSQSTEPSNSSDKDTGSASEPKTDGGCGSSVAGAALALTALGAGIVVLAKKNKKE